MLNKLVRIKLPNRIIKKLENLAIDMSNRRGSKVNISTIISAFLKEGFYSDDITPCNSLYNLYIDDSLLTAIKNKTKLMNDSGISVKYTDLIREYIELGFSRLSETNKQ